jgi:AraC-like DNA-binding protein
MTFVGDYLLANGVCPARFLDELGLPPASLLGGRLWLDRDAGLSIADQLGRASGDSFPGMHIAEMIDLRSYGLWSAKILNSSTVEEAIRAAADRIDLIESGRLLRLSVDGQRASLETAFLDRVTANPREYLDASLKLLSRFIGLAAEDIPLEVHLVHERPADTTELERLIGTNIVFNAGISALVFDRDALAVPLDPRKVEDVLTSPHSLASDHVRTAARVARTVEQLLASGRPTAAGVARELSLNLRTMQRDLAAWGVSYEQMLDDILFYHAKSELRNEGRSITDVAFNIGYSDSAHFSRAFKRWSGCTPREFRFDEATVPRSIGDLLVKLDSPRQLN